MLVTQTRFGLPTSNWRCDALGTKSDGFAPAPGLSAVTPHWSDTFCAHESCNAALATRLISLAQVEEYSRRTVDPVAGGERRTDELKQTPVVQTLITHGLLQPRAEAASGDVATRHIMRTSN
jgi:hypothetical protein